MASGERAEVMVRMNFGPARGIAFSPGDRYKLGGDPGDCLWWAAGLDRLGPDEVHDRFPEIRRPPPAAPVLEVKR